MGEIYRNFLDRIQKNATWFSVPEDVKEELKRSYALNAHILAHTHSDGRISLIADSQMIMLENIFGKHNLISDTEAESATDANPTEETSAPSAGGYIPGAILFPGERIMLQETASYLNRLYERVFAISRDYEERVAISEMQQRCKDCASLRLCPEWKFLPKYRATALYPDGISEKTDCNIDPEDSRMIVSACLSKYGPRGYIIGGEEVDAILPDLKALKDKIEKLLHIESLRTTDNLINKEEDLSPGKLTGVV